MRAKLGATLGVLGLALACSRTIPGTDDDAEDSQAVPDLPPEDEDIAGIIYSFNYGAGPSRFVACDSGEEFEITFPSADDDFVWKGACYGVYTRILGHVDRSFEPPRVVLADYLEARWCTPSDCGGDCVPDYDSCKFEDDVPPNCDPVLDDQLANCNPGGSKCAPVRFYATQTAGWMHDVCRALRGDGVAGDPCEYPAEPGDIDTCGQGFRCWNPAGDITQPGTCVRYCDPAGEYGEPCPQASACVPCSANDSGLCLDACEGEACSIDAFC